MSLNTPEDFIEGLLRKVLEPQRPLVENCKDIYELNEILADKVSLQNIGHAHSLTLTLNCK